jgi:hypothetical protein
MCLLFACSTTTEPENESVSMFLVASQGLAECDWALVEQVRRLSVVAAPEMLPETLASTRLSTSTPRSFLRTNPKSDNRASMSASAVTW